MASGSLMTGRSRNGGPGSSLRITPSNSPGLKVSARSPNKTSLHQSTLSLQTVIGTTATNPNGFSSHDQSRSFALCAGSAVILAELDDENNVSQRFFKARPSASSVNPITSFYNQSTPPSTPDTRAKPISSIKANGTAHNGSPSSDLAEANSPRSWSSRERIKAVTSVAISPNGRMLAVGETGYNPRVLIFSTAKDASSEIPLSILTEHTIGIRSLSFSPTSQYLATLGDVNDGFLFIWAVNLKTGSARLHSTNKCTFIVRQICWMGQSLITVGARQVKVWRLPEARPVSPNKSRLNTDSTTSSPTVAPKTLSGRNCVLETLGNFTFSSIASISDNEAIVGTDEGALCLLEDSEGTLRMSFIKYMGFGILSLATDSDRSCIWVGGRERRMQRLPFELLRSPSPCSPDTSGRTSAGQRSKGPSITCMGSLGSHLVTVDSSREIQIRKVEEMNDDGEQSQMPLAISAHEDAVRGISPLARPNRLQADFFTWSSKGSVNFWDVKGVCQSSRTIALEQLAGADDSQPNELKILRATEDLELFISGDKFGVLRVLLGKSWKCANQVRAHGGEITDVALLSTPDSCLIASSGRDRMVQLFRSSEESLQLVQTMDDHISSVSRLLFIKNGEKLLSCSPDRTIVIRERMTRENSRETVVAYLISRVITLKASPVSITPSADDLNVLIISTVDRCIQQYDIDSGKHLRSFKTTDSESSDTVVMGSLTMATEIPGQSPALLIGVSGTDKSIRVYDMDREVLLTAEFGHAEGVSDVCLLHKEAGCSEKPVPRAVISAGLDGVVMIWNLLVQPLQPPDSVQNNSGEEDVGARPKELTVSKPPLRKILSKSELAEFQRQDNITRTPTPVRGSSQSLVRKTSKLSLTPSSVKNEKVAPTTPSSRPTTRRSPTSQSRLQNLRGTPSPSPRPAGSGKKPSNTNHHTRRVSSDFRSRGRNPTKGEIGSLNTSTEQLCRTLKAYRRKLHGSTEHLQSQKELERELDLTLRALASRNRTCENTEMETDSSGKENEQTPNQFLHVPRRISSTSSLN